MKKRILAMVLLLTMIIPLSACKKDEDKGGNNGSVQVDVPEEDGYDFGTLNCDGAEFTFLNAVQPSWNMKDMLVPEEMLNEEVSDAVYSRNLKIESLYNVKIRCMDESVYDTADTIRIQCESGDNTYAAAFIKGDLTPSLIAANALSDLSANSNIQIYEPWWNQQIREDSQFGGASTLYFAQSDISLTAFELTWCIVGNLDTIDRLKLENPYDLVNNGQWTIDKMIEMSKEAATPNNDGSYEYIEGSECKFGFTTYHNYTAAGLNGAESFLVKKNTYGMPEFTGKGEHFLDVVAKYASAFKTPGVFVHAQEEGMHYEEVFADGRALFAGVEIKATSLFRNKGINYAILPVPKYSAEQESYHSSVNHLAPVLVVPNTNAETEKTGIILDAMAYLSYKELLPVYYDSNLSLKAAQDMESSEILDIIRDTRCFETSLVYGWTTDFRDDVATVFCGMGAGTSASTAIATHEKKIVASIDSYIATLG